MKKEQSNKTAEKLRLLPSVDALLRSRTAQEIARESGASHSTTLAQTAVDFLRSEILRDNSNEKSINLTRNDLLNEAENQMRYFWKSEQTDRLQKVINATGVIVHTNLGRAPLSQNARQALIENAAGYCNLEFDLQTGKRGRRGNRAERLLAELTGAESALIVNNCAAAAFLILTVLAKGGEAIISRGELVEIGGDFRVPDVLEQSGATLREVGTTNRTRLADFEQATNENTRLILRVHPSNFRIVGFTAMPTLTELAELAHRKNILLYEDAGSGAFLDLSRFGLTDEPIIGDSIRAGADIVSFSGDKLLGGAQAGLIVGREEVLAIMRKHPLYRALRVDKLIYAALEATFESFRRETALQEVPVLKMLSASAEELKIRATKFTKKLLETLDKDNNLKVEIIEGKSVIGGGSAPTVQPATSLIALTHEKIPAAKIEENLRFSDPSVIARILEEKVLIDLRTVSESEEIELLKVLENI